MLFPISGIRRRRFSLPYLADRLVFLAYIEARNAGPAARPFSQWPRAGECA